MSLQDVVNLTITATSVTPTRLGFGTPLIMAYHSRTPHTIDEYTDLAGMIADGFLTTDPAYKVAAKCFSQNPRPSKVLIGKRLLAYTQTLTLTVIKVTAGYHYVFNVVSPLGVVTAINYTVLADATTSTVATALAALIDAATDVTASATGAAITVATTAGKLANLTGLPNPAIMTVADITADPGIATDMAAVTALDPSTWYGVLLDSNSKAEVVAAAAYVETLRKLMLANSADSAVVDPSSTTDVAYVLKAASYARTGLVFDSNELLSYAGAAWMGGMLPTDPGAGTWQFRTLASVTVDALTPGQVSAARAKNATVYTNVGGVNITDGAKVASGEWIDVIHFIDWLFARIQERIFGLLAAASAAGTKIPYTDSGVDTIRGALMAQLTAGVNIGGLAADPAPTVTAPKVKDVDAASKVARNLPNVKFTGTLAGAIHATTISGVISV